MVKKTKTTTAALSPAAPKRAPTPSRVYQGYGARVLVVPTAAVEAADAILVQHMGAGWDDCFLYRQPPWDGFSEPEPPADCWAQILKSNETEVAAYAAACFAVCSQIPGARTYDAISAFEVNPATFPRNTMDSIYAEGYDDALPVETLQVGVAAWYFETTGNLPVRDVFGGE